MYNDSILLKDKFTIYNNLATSGDTSGRLSINYRIYPAPTIFWEFETATKEDPALNYDGGYNLKSPFKAKFLDVPSAAMGSSEKISVDKAVGQIYTGTMPKVVVGDVTLIGKSFSFYLPNTAFQEVGMLGHNSRTKEITYSTSQTSKEWGGTFTEGFAEIIVKDKFSLNMHTPIESIDWLRDIGYRKSIGTYLTTSGTLSLEEDISIYEAIELLDNMTFLLSFANGGFIAPLVVNMNQRDFEKEYPSIYSAYVVDPVEHIMTTWFNRESDIAKVLECFPAFQKMLKTDAWKSNFHHILTWYFQAVQPLGIQQNGKPWPIAANALGAALEKLASIILIDELKQVNENEFENNWSLERRIRELLHAIGITEIMKYDTQNPKYGARDVVWWFIQMRNDATHSKQNYDWTAEKVNLIGESAIQWIEEILLWRLGYQGKYRDRWRGDQFSTPSTLHRYNLGLRDPSW